MQVNGFFRALTTESKAREEFLSTLGFAQPQRKTLLSARESSSSKTVQGGSSFDAALCSNTLKKREVLRIEHLVCVQVIALQ